MNPRNPRTMQSQEHSLPAQKPSQARVKPVNGTVWMDDVFSTYGRRAINMNSQEVLVQELADDTFETVGEVSLTNQAHGPRLTATHDSRFLYVIAYPNQSQCAELYEIDLRYSTRIARTLPLPDGWFQGVAVHCASSRIFVSDAANRTIWVVNRNYFTIQWQISLDGEVPGALAMSPNGDALYALSADGTALWVIDPNSNRVLGRSRHLDGRPGDAQPLADGSRIYIWHAHEGVGVCVARVMARSRESGRMVFAVDPYGNCEGREVRTAA